MQPFVYDMVYAIAMAIRVALFPIPAVAVAGLVLLLNGLDASTGLAVAAFGMFAVATGSVLGYLVDHLPQPPQARHSVAAHMGMTPSVISCIESGQYATSSQTLKKLGVAFGGRVVVGFEFGAAKRPERELVAL